MKSETREFFTHVAVGAIGGLIGTMMLEKISTAFYEREGPKAKEREDQPRKDGDPPMRLAKRISGDVLRLDLPDRQNEKLAMGIHYRFGGMAPAVALLPAGLPAVSLISHSRRRRCGPPGSMEPSGLCNSRMSGVQYAISINLLTVIVPGRIARTWTSCLRSAEVQPGV